MTLTRLHRMPAPILAAALLGLAAGGAQASDQPAGASAGYRACGNVTITPNSGDAFARVRAKGLSCGRARTTLRRWAKHSYKPSTGPVGWRCGAFAAAQRTTCKRRAQRISFLNGT